MKKLQPAVQTLSFATTVPAGTTVDVFIDISQAASLVNRRFYRQGLNWAVSGMKFLSQSSNPLNGSIVVEKLPETWVMGNAWEKSFRVWQRMIDNATEEAGSESIKGRFLDFKVFADADHHLAGSAANLLPVNAIATAAPGQWQMSDITIPTQGTGAAVDFELIAVGPNDPGAGASGKDAKSLIQGYADSRALPAPEDPNVPADANTNWMLNLFDDGTAQDAAVTNMLEATGDNPPYPFEGDAAGTPDTMYPGGETQLPGLQIHSSEYVTGTTIGGTTRIKGGMFPCGLIGLRLTNSDSEFPLAHVIELDLVPGSHRGYLATPMTEM